MELQGTLRKMTATWQADEEVRYALPLGDQSLPLNPLIGKRLRLEFTGTIHCVACQRKIKKSFQQGYCFPCMRRLPETDMCMVRPETCAFEQGGCRDADWGRRHCLIPHTVYLANSSGVKVGITRDLPVRRWIDQGAVQGLAILQTKGRYESGLIEVALRPHITDKTNWRRMLAGDAGLVDLGQRLDQLREFIPGQDGLEWLRAEPVRIIYPVREYPAKVSSLNFDKAPVVEGTLQGIKGQYLLLDTGVINIRKFTGYEVRAVSA